MELDAYKSNGLSPPEPLLTAREIGDRVGVHPKTVLKWFNSGKISGVRIIANQARPVRFRWSEIERAFG